MEEYVEDRKIELKTVSGLGTALVVEGGSHLCTLPKAVSVYTA